MNQEQLGYIVYGYNRCNNGVQGLVITVQSQKHPKEVELRVEAFLHHMDVSLRRDYEETTILITFLIFQKYILDQSDDEFERHRKSVITDKLERPKQLIGRSYMYLSEINNQQYHFDRTNVEVEALKNVTKAQLYDFYKVLFVN